MNQIYTPPLTRVNMILIGLHVGLFILQSILDKAAGVSLIKFLGLSLSGVKSGLITQFFTFPFIEVSFMSVLFNSLIIWFIGSELESRWSETFYLKFLLLCSFVTGLFYIVLSLVFGGVLLITPLHGVTSMTFAMLIAYAMIFAERELTFMLLFPMKAKYFCWLLIGIELYMAIFSPFGASSWAHLFSILAAFLYLKVKSLKARGASMSELFPLKMREKKKKSKFTVLTGGKDQKNSDNNDPKYWQ